MSRNNWSKLNHLQIGRYAEHLVKMEFTMYGYDVYSSEVDDKGIDFIIRKNESQYYDIQVKSCTQSTNYIRFLKKSFSLRTNLIAAVVRLNEGKPPEIFLIPSLELINPDYSIFVERNYDKDPQWGINISETNISQLKKFDFDEMIKTF